LSLSHFYMIVLLSKQRH